MAATRGVCAVLVGGLINHSLAIQAEFGLAKGPGGESMEHDKLALQRLESEQAQPITHAITDALSRSLDHTIQQQAHKQDPTTTSAAPTPSKESPKNLAIGDKRCPCIGASWEAGEVLIGIEYNGSIDKYPFPANLGTGCHAWETGNHPDCTGAASDPDWCVQRWCYVDPCNCDIEVSPKVTSYLPDALYQGMGVYYSYATCGGTDSFTADQHKTACVNQADQASCEGLEKCGWDAKQQKCGGKEVIEKCKNPPKLDATFKGQEECRCVGIRGIDGFVETELDGAMVKFPADIGATCQAWDKFHTPSCLDPNTKADWCEDKWCWVDPCSCNLPAPPVTSSYFPTTTFQGRLLYYSYGTCGSADAYTAGEHDAACVNQNTSLACRSLDKCAWTKDGRCLGKDLVGVCGGALRIALPSWLLAGLLVLVAKQ